jgi:PadR family transcriptional regulator, regulatory protein PadR
MQEPNDNKDRADEPKHGEENFGDDRRGGRRHGFRGGHGPRHGRHSETGHGGHGCGERNFWHEWRAGRHMHGEQFELGQPLSPKEMEAWREFFHQSFGTWPEAHWIFGGRRFSPWHQGMDTFNPFVATLLSKGGGLLPLYVLDLIAQQPRYGNEIMDLLAERTNGQWVSNPGAIYPLLTLLEREGFIEGKWEDPEKRTVRVYTITATGQAEVARIKMIVAPKLEETVQVLQEFLKDLHSQPAEGDPAATPDDASQDEARTDAV